MSIVNNNNNTHICIAPYDRHFRGTVDRVVRKGKRVSLREKECLLPRFKNGNSRYQSLSSVVSSSSRVLCSEKLASQMLSLMLAETAKWWRIVGCGRTPAP